MDTNKIHGNASKGIQCKVIFIESERCTEIWFLYHFSKYPITKKYNSYKELENDLHKHIPKYEKSEKYFRTLRKGLFRFLADQGNLEKAVENSESSLQTKDTDGRRHTFSEMHLFLKSIGVI